MSSEIGNTSPAGDFSGKASTRFGFFPKPWLAVDLDKKEEGDNPNERTILLTGIFSVDFDERVEFEAFNTSGDKKHWPNRVQFREKQTKGDFVSFVQHFPWWKFPWWRKIKMLEKGVFYTILMTERSRVFLGVPVSTTICPDMKGGVFIHSHLVHGEGKFSQHLQSLRDASRSQDLRKGIWPVGLISGIWSSISVIGVSGLAVLCAGAIWNLARVLFGGE